MISVLLHPTKLFASSSLDVQFVVLSLAYVVFCFILLGVCASDYLCPTVSTITGAQSSTATRSRGVLAAVLLAWCNSSPDLITNFMSWTSSNAPALSVGEVLGSCGFILCVVQGALFIVMSPLGTQLEPNHALHLRHDLAFVLAAAAMMLYVSFRNEVTLLNCLAMLGLYSGYIASKTWGCSDSNELSLELSAQAPVSGSNNELEPSTLKFSVLSALDYTALYAAMQQPKGPLTDDLDAITLQTLEAHHSDAQYVAPRSLSEPPNGSPHLAKNADLNTVVAHSSPSTFERYRDNEDMAPANDAYYDDNDVSPIAYSDTLRSRLLRLREGALFLFAPQLLNFRALPMYSKVLAIAMVPLTVNLRLTCPQFDVLLRRSTVSANRTILEPKTLALLLAHSVCVPACTLLLVGVLVDSQIPWWSILVCGLVTTGLLSSTIMFRWQVAQVNRFSLHDTELHDSRAAYKLGVLEQYFVTVLNSLGIINCVLWIAVFANALVEVMVTYQHLTNISEGVLGLTIFSWGNSVSDLVSNVAMCKLHLKMGSQSRDEQVQLASRYFFIALSACLGGILLNILIGVGLSGFISMSMNANGNGMDSTKIWLFRSVSIQSHAPDYKFIISSAFILVQNVVLLVVFSGADVVSKWVTRYSRYVGIMFCSWWGLATLVSVIIEVTASTSSAIR
ncbi:LAFA_0E19218g1_1 [Lachancea sp. 'fantastica']|nr:LAFA_0E19218g1_1 [Lachancea sp. 'fantastica']